MKNVLIKLVAAFFIVAISCKDHKMEEGVRIIPIDGAINIARDGNVTLLFAKPADSGIIATNFHACLGNERDDGLSEYGSNVIRCDASDDGSPCDDGAIHLDRTEHALFI